MLTDVAEGIRVDEVCVIAVINNQFRDLRAGSGHWEPAAVNGAGRRTRTSPNAYRVFIPVLSFLLRHVSLWLLLNAAQTAVLSLSADVILIHGRTA